MTKTQWPDPRRATKLVDDLPSRESTSDELPGNRPPPTLEEIRRVMSALGKIGGPRGGKARAKKLSKEERVAIAKKAADSRWGKGDQ